MDILSSSSGRTYKTDLHYIIKVSRVCHQQPSEKNTSRAGLQTAAGTRTLSEFIKRPETSTALCFLKAEGLFVSLEKTVYQPPGHDGEKLRKRSWC